VFRFIFIACLLILLFAPILHPSIAHGEEGEKEDCISPTEAILFLIVWAHANNYQISFNKEAESWRFNAQNEFEWVPAFEITLVWRGSEYQEMQLKFPQDESACVEPWMFESLEYYSLK